MANSRIEACTSFHVLTHLRHYILGKEWGEQARQHEKPCSRKMSRCCCVSGGLPTTPRMMATEDTGCWVLSRHSLWAAYPRISREQGTTCRTNAHSLLPEASVILAGPPCRLNTASPSHSN
eukprot:COSAG01_NODE_14048_length_1502_cov_1.847470_2_plen_121_part_00